MSCRLYTAQQTRALDRDAIERQNIPGPALMARAAEAVCRLIRKDYPQAHRLVVYVGVGNNAGDGYLVARRMRELGRSARVVELAPAASLRGDAKAAREKAAAAGVVMRPFAAAGAIDEELVVDALLGTGLSRAVAGDWAAAVDQINAAPAAVVAVDLPSGLGADTGVADPHTVRADRTVTFLGRKRGLYTADGPDYAGSVSCSDLEAAPCDPGLFGESEVVELHDWAGIRRTLRPRRRNTHKKDYGHVLVVGGHAGFQGAAELCGAAALRCGSGLVSLAQPPGAPGVLAAMPELMRHEILDRRALRRLAASASVVAVGPGLGRDAWAQEMLGEVLDLSCPQVIDADALRLLAAEPREAPAGGWALTPHPGEAAALLGTTAAAVQADRFSAVGRIREIYGAAVVLKGCGTLVAGSDGGVGVCAGGNPGMATAGTGDVLTGVIASLIGQGWSVDRAALAGACLHAAAGDRAGAQGSRGLVAGDLLAPLRALSELPHAG